MGPSSVELTCPTNATEPSGERLQELDAARVRTSATPAVTLSQKVFARIIHHFAGSRVWTLLFCGEIIRPRPVLRQNTVGDIVSRDGFEAPRVAIRGIMTRMTALPSGRVFEAYWLRRNRKAGSCDVDCATSSACRHHTV